MLVLSRRVGESIQIGDDIYVTLVRAADGRARLGITAPREVPILRTELLTRPIPAGREEREVLRAS